MAPVSVLLMLVLLCNRKDGTASAFFLPTGRILGFAVRNNRCARDPTQVLLVVLIIVRMEV